MTRAEITPDGVTVIHGDALDTLRTLPAESIDAVVTDPPAGVSFMNRSWDHHRGGRAEWVAWLAEIMVEAHRVLKPGGHALVWALPRTSHWTATALEDAGFEIRDCIVHLFGSGFPKSRDVGKAIDKAAGAEREVVGQRDTATGSNKETNTLMNITAPATPDAQRWDGWGTALKPGQEHWWLVRKPFPGTVASNVLAHGVGGLNVDGCRVGMSDTDRAVVDKRSGADDGQRDGIYSDGLGFRALGERFTSHTAGRWPTNIVFTHSASCVEGGECADDCPAEELDRQSGVLSRGRFPGRTAKSPKFNGTTYNGGREYGGGIDSDPRTMDDSGGASRFYPIFRYQAKAPTSERPKVDGVAHPTAKSLGLMRWLCRLITPSGGVVLDMFAGSGTTLEAARLEGFRAIGIEAEADYLPLIAERLDRIQGIR